MELGRFFQFRRSARLASISNLAPGFELSMSATRFFEVRLYMKKTGWFSRLFNPQPFPARIQLIVAGIASAAFVATTGIAAAQNPAPGVPVPAPDAQMVVPDGYTMHQTVDLGGRITGLSGSPAMYSTLVNLQSGPRVLGETFELRALPGKKNTLIDSLSAVGSGFGGDPNNFARLTFSKGKLYDFTGMFRRDRQYFDYDLLGNPNIVGGQSIPIGPAAAPTGSFAWPQVEQSPFLYNTVRRMTDTGLTILPLAKVTFSRGQSTGSRCGAPS
jgi:hypothetical protein